MTGPTRGGRTTRTGWASGCATTLTRRDHDLFYFLGVCGLARTRDVSRLFFGSRVTATDRLRKLYVAKYVTCFAPALSGDNLYALAERGRDALVEAKGVDATALRLVRAVPKKLAHQLMILDLRLHLALACRNSTRYRLVAFDSDADLASERHAALLDLIPDARVVIEDKGSGQRLGFLLECDLGTESLTWLVRRKLEKYATAAATKTPLYGLVDPLILLVVPSVRRARGVAERLCKERVAAKVVLTIATMLDEQNVLGASYALPGDLDGVDADDVKTRFVRRLLP